MDVVVQYWSTMTRGFFSQDSGDNEEPNNDGFVETTATAEDWSGENENSLDSDERLMRRLFKKHLRQLAKLKHYETQLQQSILRNNDAVAESAKREWEKHMQKFKDDPDSVLNYKAPCTGISADGNFVNGSGCEDNDTTATAATTTIVQSRLCQLNQASVFRYVHTSIRSLEEKETPRVQEGRAWLRDFREKLVPKILSAYESRVKAQSNTNDPQKENRTTTKVTNKERRALHAAELKGNMHKGTQTESHFEDELALLGYTAQKFHERAVLAFSSLDRLDPCYRDENTETKNNAMLLACIWERLLSIEQVVSIGCGPGCDATGVLAFFESHGVKLANGILLLDFVIDAWKETALNTLIPMISPRVPFVRTLACDVREPILQDSCGDETNSNKPNADACFELTKHRNHRLIVVSYLITETRYKWKSFFADLLQLLRGTESLLLLTEPTGWQLREFLNHFGKSSNGKDGLLIKAHVWLDSSRDYPHLQALDSRNGPAILLVCTN